MRWRAGIIGTGFIGQVHAQAIRNAGAVVSRVAASDPQRAREAADRLGSKAAASGAELIDADDVDVVHICTPNSLHVPLARQALAAGKAVVCEKPLATSLADAKPLTEYAEARTAYVPFVYRFYPTVRDIKERIERGDAGDLLLFHGAYLQDWQAGAAGAGWRGEADEGGALSAFGDIGVHWFDLVEFASGHRVTRVVARVGGGGVDTTVLFETDRGAGGSVVVSQHSLGRNNSLRFSLDGTEAAYRFDQQNPERMVIGTLSDERIVARGTSTGPTAAARYSLLPPGHPQGYQDAFNAFMRDAYAALDGPAPDGLPTFADGLRAAAITDAVARSAAARADTTSPSWTEVPS